MGNKPDKEAEEAPASRSDTRKERHLHDRQSASSGSDKRGKKKDQRQTGQNRDDDDNSHDMLKRRGSGDFAASPDEAIDYYRKRTMRPMKKTGSKRRGKHGKRGKREKLQATMRATLGGGKLRDNVKLPDGEDLNEWLAVNAMHFYNVANMIFATCSEFCTDMECPDMTGDKYEYLWKDGVRYVNATRVSAPTYIGFCLEWIEDTVNNPKVFPLDDEGAFPKDFRKHVMVIFKRIFRMYAHIFYHHFKQLKQIEANAHLNTCFKHFMLFSLEFDLIPKAEQQPLKSLIAKFVAPS